MEATPVIDKRGLSERGICTKFITPALLQAGWDEMLQIREEVTFTKGRVIVRGKLVARGTAKRDDYSLYHKANIPISTCHHGIDELKHGVALLGPLLFRIKLAGISSVRPVAQLDRLLEPLKGARAPMDRLWKDADTIG